jgi:hypothetical protein
VLPRNKASVLAAALLDKETEQLTRKAIDLALKGDVIALRLCLERILPAARERPCSFKLPKLETCQDATNALAAIVAGMASGELLPHEAESLSNVVNSFMKSIELSEIETRLVASSPRWSSISPPKGSSCSAGGSTSSAGTRRRRSFTSAASADGGKPAHRRWGLRLDPTPRTEE